MRTASDLLRTPWLTSWSSKILLVLASRLPACHSLCQPGCNSTPIPLHLSSFCRPHNILSPPAFSFHSLLPHLENKGTITQNITSKTVGLGLQSVFKPVSKSTFSFSFIHDTMQEVKRQSVTNATSHNCYKARAAVAPPAVLTTVSEVSHQLIS